MSEKSERLNHPLASYVLGLVVLLLTLVVLIGVLHHLTVSHHGPQLLVSIKKTYLQDGQSTLLNEAIRIEDMETHRHFHQVVDPPRIPEDMDSTCSICHSELPHRKHKRIRALMNMHTQYFVCETCHIRDRVGATIIYRWYSPLEAKPKGPFFGTRYDPETGRLIVGDPFSKIAPLFKYDDMVPPSVSFARTDNIWPAIQTQNAPMARDFIRIRDKLTPEQREGAKNIFHENIKPKGHHCQTCHTENSIFDFKELGFVDKRTEDLTRLEVSGMIEKYDKFYFPELFTDPVVPIK